MTKRVLHRTAGAAGRTLPMKVDAGFIVQMIRHAEPGRALSDVRALLPDLTKEQFDAIRYHDATLTGDSAAGIFYEEAPPRPPLSCGMRRDCDAPVTHLDEKGFIYCRAHGIQRRESGYRCRQLTAAELAAIERGEQVKEY